MLKITSPEYATFSRLGREHPRKRPSSSRLFSDADLMGLRNSKLVEGTDPARRAPAGSVLLKRLLEKLSPDSEFKRQHDSNLIAKNSLDEVLS